MQDNQLEVTYLALLNCLSNQQAPEPEPMVLEDQHMLIEDAEIEEVEVEEMIEEAREEEQQQEQEYEPYQLTCYYRNQLEQFQEDYIQWEENQYYLHCQHLEVATWNDMREHLGYYHATYH